MDACYHDHEGYNVTLSNNIFVKAANTPRIGQNSAKSSHQDGTLRSAAPSTAQHWHAAFNLHGNIIASEGGAPLFSPGSDLQWGLSTFDQNCYWQLGKKQQNMAPLFPYNKTLKQWQTDGPRGGRMGGQDKHSIVSDPLFADVSKNNFALLSNSRAITMLGFKQIDTSKIGPRP